MWTINIPSSLRAGDTVSWNDSSSDYPATSGWTLEYAIRAYSKSPITITASANNADYAVSIPVSTSKNWASGNYTWQAYVYKASNNEFTEKHTLATGQVEILPNLTQVGTQTDLRSHAKKVLDAIETLLEGKALAGDALSYSIAGRSISKMSPEELITWRSFYKTEYQKELQAEAAAQGLDANPDRIGIRFRRI